MRSEEYRYIISKFNEKDLYTFSMKIKDLLSIYYVAARGLSTEQGAVQRILNKRRIDDIKSFILSGNLFVNTFIINWTDITEEPKVKKETLNIPLDGRRAQVLDGQHRISGLREAVHLRPEIGEKYVLVSMALQLTTPEAANIFLNINSEQKPVPKSLIYDLFGQAFDDKEHAINRATDIINFLNKDESSPYFQMIKYPGNQKNAGLIDLAIFVNAIKPHLNKDGVFNTYNLNEIETQKKIIKNFYTALKDTYKKFWDIKSENPFFKAAGFNGSFDFLCEVLIPKCIDEKSFSTDKMKELMKLDSENLFLANSMKNLDGKSARKNVKTYLNENFLKDIPQSDEEYEF
nr:DGQHR domain-containing protein [uncultured Flavobacterium sp.]